MKKNIFLVIKGFAMGIANIIPGVSGGTLAIILGIYEDFIGALSHFFKNFKKNIAFLIPLFIGIGLSIITMSSVIDYSYKHFPIPTALFFVGLVLGGIPMLYGKVKDNKKAKKQISSWVIMLLTFSLVIFMVFADKIFGTSGEVVLTNMDVFGYILLFFVGIIAAATMVIPGVSGSLVLMLLGYYYPVIALIKELTHFKNLFDNVIALGIFGVGVLVGIVLIAKLIEFLFNKYETKTYYGVLGFIFASIIAIPISSFSGVDLNIDVVQVTVGILMIGIGSLVSYKLGEN